VLPAMSPQDMAAARPQEKPWSVTCLGYTLRLGDVSTLPIVVGFSPPPACCP